MLVVSRWTTFLWYETKLSLSGQTHESEPNPSHRNEGKSHVLPLCHNNYLLKWLLTESLENGCSSDHEVHK